MSELVRYLIFWGVFIVGFFTVFRILQAVEIEKYFKKYRTIEIHAAYLIITVLTSYFLGKFILDMIDLFPWN